MHAPSSPPAGLLRRLAAGAYDLLPLAALLMLTGLLAVALNGGEPVPPGNLGFQAALLLMTAGFYVGFWCRGGQTLGMRAWRLRVETISGQPLDIHTGLLRFLAALVSVAALGLGLAWVLIDPQRRAWHDRWTGTRVVLVPKS